MRATPFSFVFEKIAAQRFAGIAAAIDQEGVSPADRDEFVLLEPVGRLLREIVPEDAGPDALEGHALLLHHAYRHWAQNGWVYRISESALIRAVGEPRITTAVPHSALYLQLPELRVWGTPTSSGPAEPLDGVFVTETTVPGGIAVLGIYGMRPDRPGFSAIGVEGRADTDDAGESEIEIAAAREGGSPPFGPILAGGSSAGLHSLANPGELLLLVCRLLTVLPQDGDGSSNEASAGLERVVDVE